MNDEERPSDRAVGCILAYVGIPLIALVIFLAWVASQSGSP